jgi:excisionase family DNA binding protein
MKKITETRGRAGSATSSVLTLEEVANYLRVHPNTIYRLIKRKQINMFKVGHTWRLRRQALDGWMRDVRVKITNASEDNRSSRQR